MKDIIYLIVSEGGARRMTKRRPDLFRDEIAIRLRVHIPDECFRTLIIDAVADIPEEMVIHAEVEPEIEPEAAE